jgi:hypothetical protein
LAARNTCAESELRGGARERAAHREHCGREPDKQPHGGAKSSRRPSCNAAA